MELNEIYRNKAHLFIPAGAHTYSRTDEVFPENAPRIMEKSKGVCTWDVDGKNISIMQWHAVLSQSDIILTEFLMQP